MDVVIEQERKLNSWNRKVTVLVNDTCRTAAKCEVYCCGSRYYRQENRPKYMFESSAVLSFDNVNRGSLSEINIQQARVFTPLTLKI